MWQVDWGASPPEPASVGVAPPTSKIDPATIDAAYLLFWEEHCVECAFPTCYTTCPLFIPRPDQKCARFQYGIYPNRAFSGLVEYGADVQFRRWGKLESQLVSGAAPIEAHRKLARQDTALLKIVHPVSAALSGVDPKRHANRVYHLARGRRISQFGDRPAQAEEGTAATFDEFVAEVYNPSPEPFALVLELIQEAHPGYRTSFAVQPGANFFRVPYGEIGVDLSRGEGRLLVYPDGDAEVRAVFTWLDFVRYRPGMAPVDVEAPPTVRSARPANKVKCVAWDLDNTVWQGVLVEDGPEDCIARPEVLGLIERLDERGIVQVVVSKNDEDFAWSRIAALGLADKFVAKAINWGSKSQNLHQVADALNLNLDAIVLIDDSPFERAEVESELPQVRTYDALNLTGLLEKPEFDVPVTEEGKRRRLSYLAEGNRKTVSQQYGSNYADFIRSCEIHAELFTPREASEVDRCLELIQRSNQLNLSTVRYEHSELATLLDDPDIINIALRVRDRFGDYGIVGFASVDVGGRVPVLKDLVISCRVARKKIEHAWFAWLGDQFRRWGCERLDARYVRSARNGVLLDTLGEIGFTPGETVDGAVMLNLPLNDGRRVPDSDLVAVVDQGVELESMVGARR